MQFAFVFPGQGSQAVGMVNDFSESFPVVKECYQEASDVINIDLWKMVQEGPVEDLNQTSNTQPAMLAASYSIWKIWASSVATPANVMAGHSFGEVSAFTCAGALTFQDQASCSINAVAVPALNWKLSIPLIPLDSRLQSANIIVLQRSTRATTVEPQPRSVN